MGWSTRAGFRTTQRSASNQFRDLCRDRSGRRPRRDGRPETSACRKGAAGKRGASPGAPAAPAAHGCWLCLQRLLRVLRVLRLLILRRLVRRLPDGGGYSSDFIIRGNGRHGYARSAGHGSGGVGRSVCGWGHPWASACRVQSQGRLTSRVGQIHVLMFEDLPGRGCSEATAKLKLSPNVQAAQATRGTALTRMGSQQADHARRTQKAFNALQAGFSPSELDRLRHQYAPACNKPLANRHPRLLLDIVQAHRHLSAVSKSWFGRIAGVSSGTDIALRSSTSATVHAVLQRRRWQCRGLLHSRTPVTCFSRVLNAVS